MKKLKKLKKVKVVLTRSELGAGTRGASMGIDAMKIAAIDLGSSYFRNHEQVEIIDENWLLLERNHSKYAKQIKGIIKVDERVARAVARVLKKGQFPVVLAGDHSTSGGTIAGIKSIYPDKTIGVVWIDAHADMHSPYTTPSGNMHGMPLASALGEDNLELQSNTIDDKTKELWEKLKNLGGPAPKILYRNLVYIALRDTELQEDHLIQKHNVKCVTVKQLRNNGTQEVLSEVLSYLEHCDHIYVSFDVDSMDPRISLGTGTPVPNGLRVKEAEELMVGFAHSSKLCCFEIVEINPTLDTENSMAETAFKILDATTNALLNPLPNEN